MKNIAQGYSVRQDLHEERTFFTVQALAAIRDAAELGANEKLVLCMIVSHANGRGLAWPSVPTLVRETGLSRAAVYRALSALESADLIVRRHPATHGGTVYDLSGLAQRTAEVSQRDRGVSLVDAMGLPERQKGLPQRPKEDLKKKKEQTRVRARRLEPADQTPAAVAEFMRRIARS